MSKDFNNDALFVDTGCLRDHVSKLREEKKLAARLYENVLVLRRLSDPSTSYQYNSILRDVNQMIEYFERMASVLNRIDDEAIRLSREIKHTIEEDTEATRYITAKELML